MRSVSPEGPERLDISAMPVTARSQAIAALMEEPPKAVSTYKARQIEGSPSPTRCHTCGHIDRTPDGGQAMDRHVKKAHGGVGTSSMVL